MRTGKQEYSEKVERTVTSGKYETWPVEKIMIILLNRV